MSSESSKLNGVQRLLEAGLIVSCLVALFIMLCLFSFNQADPGWSQTGYQLPVRNMGGAVGAYISDLLLNVFGVLAFILPFVLAFTGWLMFHKFHHLMQLDYLTLGLKIIGFIMLFIGISSLASMNFADIYFFSAGGIVGDAISHSLLPYLSFVGSTLIFLTFILAGFVLLTGISWLTLIDLIGEKTIKTILWLSALPQLIKEKFGANDNHATKHKSDEHLPANEPLSIGEGESISVVAPNHDTKIMVDPITVDVVDEPIDDVLNHANAHDVEQAGAVFDTPEDDINNEISMPEVASVMPAEEPSIEEPAFDIDMVNELIDERKEPFIAIDELMDGPIEVNVQEHVSDEEIAAAFEDLDPIELPEQTKPLVTPLVNQASEIRLPSLALLDRPDKAENPINQEELDQVSRLVEAKLKEFGVIAEVVAVYPGPVITRFELDLAPGVKVSKITNLSKDLARSLSAKSVRVVEVIPGKSVIGLELPNKHREIVNLSEVLSCDDFIQSSSALTMAIGKDIAGDSVVVDLAKMPHLLVAGTTGSGKSVAVNTMIISLLYKSTPEDVRMIMIDPKMLELSVYEGIPHLLSPVVTDMKESANALRWCVGEMERRYKLMSKLGVRNLKGYNQKIAQAKEEGTPIVDPLWNITESMDTTPPVLDKLPSIVVVVDEFADMMMVVGKKAEELIARIAQKARAAGIHLILATQRPSVDVITGLIKANIPTRMALQVQSRIDSRTILDQQGAEQLLGWGDMFYLPPGSGVPTRVHGAFIDDHEVHAVVKDWKDRGEPDYLDEILSGEGEGDILLPGEQAEGDAANEVDTLYDEALAFVTESRRVSISSIQRKFRIGYNRSARIVEDMENQGVVSRPGNNGAREVLAPPPVKG